MIKLLKTVFIESWVSSPSRAGLHIFGLLWSLTLTLLLGTLETLITKQTSNLPQIVLPFFLAFGEIVKSILVIVAFNSWLFFIYFWLFCFLFEFKRNLKKYYAD